MGRAAGSRFVVFQGGESVTETRALGACSCSCVSAFAFFCKSVCTVGMVPVYRVALQCCGQGVVGIIYYRFFQEILN